MNRREFGAWVGGNISGSFLLGTGGGVAAGAVSGMAWERAGAPRGRVSYSQMGEDLVVETMCEMLEIEPTSYLDIGAADPIRFNNTYGLYRRGARGVLVEPNPAFTAKLRSVRPGDLVIEAGIGTTDADSADYYVIGGPGDGTWNTFSREDAERAIANRPGIVWIERVEKKPLIRLDRVMEQHFAAGAPDFLSIDIEGLDFDVLGSLDFARWRPKIVCAETILVGPSRIETRTIDLMRSKGYEVRGSTWANTIFLDGRLLDRDREGPSA
jgi:FkbM family methyltransferase